MANYVEKEAKTVDTAIEEALNEMSIEKENADIQVLDEGSKGLFGIGARNALVRVYKKVDYEGIVKSFLYPVFNTMGVNEDIDILSEDNVLKVKLSADDIGIIIGRRGETLDALQYLLGLAVNKQSDKFMRVILDVCNYREKREETLIKLANRLADKVVRTKKNITLEPMNPYERRIIHATLQDYDQVETYSVGDEPNRKVVIRYKGEYRKE